MLGVQNSTLQIFMSIVPKSRLNISFISRKGYRAPVSILNLQVPHIVGAPKCGTHRRKCHITNKDSNFTGASTRVTHANEGPGLNKEGLENQASS